MSVHGAHAAEKSDLPPPRGDRGADGAPRDEDRREQRETRDSGQQRPIGTEVALDLLATPRRRHRLEARRGGERGIDRAGRVVDRHTRAERHVDLVDHPVPAEHHLRADHVHQEKVAAVGAADPARRQDAAHGEGADARRGAEPELRVPADAEARREGVGQDDARRVDQEREGVVDDAVRGLHEVQRLDRMAVGHVGGEDGEGLAGGGRVDGEEGRGHDRHRVVHLGQRAQPVGDRLGERSRAAHLERRRPRQVLDGLGEAGERAPVDHPDGDDQCDAQRDAGGGERTARAVRPDLAAGEQRDGAHRGASMAAASRLRQIANLC